jgi:hypothetical protein
MDTNITRRGTKFRRLGHLASAICSALHVIKLLFPIELVTCPNKANTVTEYTEMGVSMEDIIEYQ